MLVTFLIAAAACVTALGGFAYVVKLFRNFLKRTNNFFEDWYGTAGRDGVEPQPGVMSRIHHQDEVLAYLKAEVSYNHGHSIKDSVRDIKESLGRVEADVDTLKKRDAGTAWGTGSGGINNVSGAGGGGGSGSGPAYGGQGTNVSGSIGAGGSGSAHA